MYGRAVVLGSPPMILHREPHLTSTQHLPSWALFAFAAGSVNAGALLACDRFVSHVTGTVSRIGVDAGGILAFDYALILVVFILGAMSAILMVRRFKSTGGPAYWLPLGVVSSILFLVAGLGALGALGHFGGTVETAHDFALLAILGFAMGMQNAAVAASTGMAVRTTHMTGPATDIGVAMAVIISGTAEERAEARRSVLLRGTKLASFIAGAGAMAALAPRFTWLAFLLPAAACTVATLRSFSPAALWISAASRASWAATPLHDRQIRP